MITAKDVQKKKFEKVKFGYNPEEVDSFLAQIENDLRLMQQDLDDSNEKIQLLADKVREYKDTEDDLKNALLLAQKQARQVVEDAQQKADAIVAEAKASVDTVKSQALVDSETQLQNITAQLEAENAHLVETQHQVADFPAEGRGAEGRGLADGTGQVDLISRLPESSDEIVEYVEVEETEETETAAEAVEAAAETASETVAAAAETAATETAAAFDDVAQTTFGSRRDDAGSAARRRFNDQV